MAELRVCAVAPEPELSAYAISTIFSCAWLYNVRGRYTGVEQRRLWRSCMGLYRLVSNEDTSFPFDVEERVWDQFLIFACLIIFPGTDKCFFFFFFYNEFNKVFEML